MELDHGTILYKVEQVLEDLVGELQVITLLIAAEMVQEPQVKVMLVQVVLVIMLQVVVVEQVELVLLEEVITLQWEDLELKIVF